MAFKRMPGDGIFLYPPAPIASTESAPGIRLKAIRDRSEEHTSELQSLRHLVCRLLLEKKNNTPTAQRGSNPALYHARRSPHSPAHWDPPLHPFGPLRTPRLARPSPRPPTTARSGRGPE